MELKSKFLEFNVSIKFEINLHPKIHHHEEININY